MAETSLVETHLDNPRVAKILDQWEVVKVEVLLSHCSVESSSKTGALLDREDISFFVQLLVHRSLVDTLDNIEIHIIQFSSS